MLLTGLSATSFEFVPKVSEAIRAPTAVIATQYPNSTDYQLVLIEWALCNSQSMTAEMCGASDAFVNNFANLKDYLVCNDDFSLDQNFLMMLPNTTTNNNGTFCTSTNYKVNQKNALHQMCNITGHLDMATCVDEIGSRSTTFWTYLMLRVIFVWSANSAFSLNDATSLKMANEHNSDYSYMMFWQQVAVIFAPIIGGWAIKDGEGDGN